MNSPGDSEAQAGDKVRIHYTGTLKDGRVFDSSKSRGPLDFEIGAGEYFDDFEAAVIGMKPGEVKTHVIGYDGAYGPAREDMIIQAAKEQCPPDIQVGDRLKLVQDGEEAVFSVAEIEGDQVSLDGNHPLAGHDLVFEVELMEILEKKA